VLYRKGNESSPKNESSPLISRTHIKVKINTWKILAISVLIITISGCDTLDERVLDESLEGEGRAETVSGAVAPAYGQVGWVWRHTIYFGLQEVASDEAILPFRGGKDWFDGGKYIAVHQHLMTPGNELVTDPWNEITKNISRTVSAIEVLRPLSEDGNAEAAEALREMVALRAYLNMLMLDSWGLVFKKEATDERSEILRRDEAVEYIRTELESVVNEIGADKGPGRITKGAVWGFLARLHLNAAVYRNPYGTPDFTTEDMDKVIEYSDKIINSGNYSLSSEYFDLFKDGNINNPELIFAVDQRGVLENEHNRWAYWSLPGSLRPRPESPEADGTDGPAATPDWARTWEDEYGSFEEAAETDPRYYMEETPVPDSLQDLSEVSPGNDQDHFFCVEKTEFEVDKGILREVVWGPREGDDGSFLTCEDGKVRIYPVIQQEGKFAGEIYIDLPVQVDFTNEGRLHRKGHRFSKYQCSRTSPDCNSFSSVSLVLLRLGEVYLNRAEAKLRKGNVTGALEDVNTLRTARDARPEQTLPELTSIDLDRLYRERGFELYWEGLRRTDQIRFGKYEDSWTEKTDSDVNKRLFPIPQSAIDGATNIEGFLTQNRGY